MATASALAQAGAGRYNAAAWAVVKAGGCMVHPAQRMPAARGGGGEPMRNFLFGLLLGGLATYWYLTQADVLRGTVDDFWERASSPPIAPHGMSDSRGRP